LTNYFICSSISFLIANIQCIYCVTSVSISHKGISLSVLQPRQSDAVFPAQSFSFNFYCPHATFVLDKMALEQSLLWVSLVYSINHHSTNVPYPAINTPEVCSRQHIVTSSVYMWPSTLLATEWESFFYKGISYYNTNEHI
jgi:hypothetical protein